MEDFRTFFEQDYQGVHAFIEKIVSPVFGNLFVEATEDILQSNPNYKPAADRANILSVKRFGVCDELDVPLYFFDITLSETVRLAYSRVHIQALVRQLMETYSAALIVFHYPDNKGDWRVSYVSKGSNATDATSAKRYTYLMGKNQKCRTAAERFAILANKEKNVANITEAFSVETLTKLFYKELFDWYEWAKGETDGFEVTYPNDISTETDDRKIDEHIIRLITRLMFVWFIKQKKLVPEKIFKTLELQNILKDFNPTSKDSGNYYNAILQNLFFATLNKPINELEFANLGSFQEQREHYGIKTLFRDAKEGSWFKKSKEEIIKLFNGVPFLNGGLFECLDKENADGKIMYYDGFSRKAGRQSRAFLPNCLFFDPEKGIIPLLEKYNFTVEENTPSDVEVALDPELLGKVFENLLGAFNPETKETARKQSGSFYTPREIVNYMVDESLIAYLTNACPDIDSEIIRQLFTQDTLPEDLKQSPENCKKLIAAIKAAKMLDPACGSGAFPMGMLNRMLDLLQKLESNPSNYDTKLHLIENCIYGIDIQTIAVQITKLRFFISLICEQTPSDNANENYGIIALPNLETKFVAANTLINLKKDFSDRLDLQNEELNQMKLDLLDIRRKHFLAGKADIKLKLRDEDEKLRNKIKAYLIQSSSNPDELKIGYWKREIENLKSQRAKFEGEKWEDISIKPQLQVTLDLGFEPILETQSSIFKVDINKQKRDEIDINIKRLESDIIKEEKKTQIDGFENEAKKLAHWNPYNQNKSSGFFDPEWMFGIKGGFDLVIGNPPYVSAPKMVELNSEVRQAITDSNRFKTLFQKWDLYIPFIELSIQLLAENGIFTMIVPYPFTNQTYAKRLRELIVNQCNLIDIVDLNGTKIFENATVSNCIPLLSKTKIVGKESCYISQINDQKQIKRSFCKTLSDLVQDENTAVWNLSGDQTANRHSDMNILGDFCYISKGMVLNAHENTAKGEFTKDDLITETYDNIHCRKYIEAKDIERYRVKKIRYLEYDTKRCPNEISRPTFRELYEKPKLMFNRLGNLMVFLDKETKFLHSDSMFSAVLWKDLKGVENKSISASVTRYSNYSRKEMELYSKNIQLSYLLGVLNSKYASVLLYNIRGGDYHIYPEHLRNLPIPIISEVVQQPIVSLANRILSEKQENPQFDTIELEHQIDNLVYKLYDLTYNEVKVVDPEFGMSEEEYANFKIE